MKTGSLVPLFDQLGETGGREGVKLEQPVWITEGGPVVLSDYPLEDDYA